MAFTPKHQRKVNEVYPTKPGEDSPVSGKISSLTYYLNSRPSKKFKVMAYLERKVERDLYKEKKGYNKISLDILEGLFGACSIHFAIYCKSAFKIICCILSAGDDELFIKASNCLTAFAVLFNAFSLNSDPEFQMLMAQVLSSLLHALTSDSSPVETRHPFHLTSRHFKL